MARQFIYLTILAVLMIASPPKAHAQFIDQGIPNFPQKMSQWCWATVAQQVIAWKTGNKPAQCAMVAIANNSHPNACCNGNPQCNVPGSMQQIQALIAHFGASPSQISFPSNPMVLFQKLQNGVAVIVFVKNSPFAQIGHFVVIRGMDFSSGQPVVFVNDPLNWSGSSQPVPYWQLAQYWQAAIEVF